MEKKTETMDSNLSWDECFMRMAEAAAGRSKDSRTKVGAVLVSPDKSRVSVGYNGFPAGVEETAERWLDKHSFVVHAEVNAVLNAKCSLSDWTLYTTMFPCIDCTKLILQTGISRVVYLEKNSKSVEATLSLSTELFNEMSVSIERHHRTN
jgi:dCMP deaminase